MRAGHILLAGLLSVLAVRETAAQTVVLDEGAFRLVIAGQEAGNETFLIRQNGAGENAVVIAKGQVMLDTAGSATELSADLQAVGPALRPTAYRMNVTGANKEQLAGQVVGGRFSAKILSPAGEEMREYLASDGAVIVDEGVSHQYYFLAQRIGAQGERVPIIVPRRNQQVMAQVSDRGNETVALGRGTTSGRHLVVTVAGTERHVWVDAKGRVLRVEIPSRKFVAARVAAPK